MEITPDIYAAIKRAVKHYGNSSQLAQAIGVAHSTVFFWLNGKTTSMSGKIWQSKIRPILAPFMTPQTQQALGIPLKYGTLDTTEEPLKLQDGAGIVYKALPPSSEHVQTQGDRIPVRKINLETLAEFDPSTSSINRYVQKNSKDSDFFFKPEDFGCISVQVEKGIPSVFLPGTELLVSLKDSPENSDMVLACVRESGKIVVGTYLRNGDTVTISSPDDPDKKIGWDVKKSFGYLLWVFPIVSAALQLRKTGTDSGK